MLTLALVLSLVTAKLPPLKAPPAPSKTGTIVVNTVTPGAKLFLDDKSQGTAPMTLKNVVPGEHKVKLKKLGYLMSEETVVVEANKTLELQIDLLPYAGILTVKTQQKGAQVFVDGKGVGVVPYEGEISIGRRAVEVKKDGFQTYREVFQVGAGETYKVDVTLQKGAPETSADVPLVALVPKKKKAQVEDDTPLDIPLEAPPSLNPKAPSGAPLQVVAGGDGGKSEMWYQKWWVWTIVGAVVVGGVAGAIGGSLAAQSQEPAPAFGPWELGAGRLGPMSR